MDVVLTHEELVALTGYRRPAEQLQELHRHGFMRARRSQVTGAVILERAHYLAVCAGQQAPERPRVHKPQLRQVQHRMA
jgi:hypothetical protein